MAITSDKVRKPRSRPSPRGKALGELIAAEAVMAGLHVPAEIEAAKVEKFLVKMDRENASWHTRNGVIFTIQHPFQLVDEADWEELKANGGFRRANNDELVAFYNGMTD